jgi:CheY-like chemotaxis protein
MTVTDFQTHEDGEPFDGPGPAPLVLVIGKSRINSIVVTRIAERSGLRSTSGPPESAEAAIASLQPSIVILDGGADNCDCTEVMPSLKAARDATGGHMPVVILLSTRNLPEAGEAHDDVIDAVVSKPILPELLQPVIDRLMERWRG